MAQSELELKLTVGQTDEEYDFFCINYGDLSYSNFFCKFLLVNKPCVIRKVTCEWICQKEWTIDGSPNFDRLSSLFGHEEIPTANCNEKYFNSHPKGSMKFADYIEYWKNYKASDYPEDMPCLYLKDWHCFRECPDQVWYQVPEYFGSDWLNEYYLSFPEFKDDYRFVYMGPKGTWTPLHKDVFSSFSWSVNICGHKTWIFYPPDQVSFLTDRLGNLAFDINVDKDKEEFSRISKAKCYILEQGPGDALFVPSGWYHQVWNKKDTISINHNWINACNIEHMFTNLIEELTKVEKELSDCQDSTDWDSDCQRLLKSTFGFDFTQFLQFLGFIAEKRIDAIEATSTLLLQSGHTLGIKHMIFDLNSIKKVLQIMTDINYKCIKERVDLLLNKIINVLDCG